MVVSYIELLNLLIKEIQGEPPFYQKARMKDNPELTAKEVEIHPKRGKPYRAIRYVRRDAADEGKSEPDVSPEEDVPETDSIDIFDEGPRNDTEFIEQAKTLRDWFDKNAVSASFEEREEKVKWYINNVNDERQNELSDSYILESGSGSLGGIHGASLVQYNAYADLAVFKPSLYDLGSHITRQIGGSQILREVAAYTFSKLFKEFDGLVPATSMHAGIDKENSSMGSIQEFMEIASNFIDEKDRTYEDIYEEYGEDSDEMRAFEEDIMGHMFVGNQTLIASIFDSLIWNIDRHQWNFMSEQGDLRLIDNGAAFPTIVSPDISVNNNAIIGESDTHNKDLSNEHRGLIENVLDRQDEIYKALIPYLDDDAIDAIFYRAEKLLEKGKYALLYSDMGESKWGRR